jgi:hypothetical protein
MNLVSLILFLHGLAILILIAAIWASNRRHERRLDAMRAAADRKRDESYTAARAHFLK